MQRDLLIALGAALLIPSLGWAQGSTCPPAETSRSAVVLAATGDRPGVLRIRAAGINGGAPLSMAEARVVGIDSWRSVADSAVIELQALAGRPFVVEVRAIGHGIARTTTRLAPDSGLVALAVMVPITIRIDEHCTGRDNTSEGQGAAGARVMLRDGPDAWVGYWDGAAIVLNDRLVYCPERRSQNTVPRLSAKTLQRLNPDRVEHIEMSRTAPVWVESLCGGPLKRVLHFQYRGKPPRGGKERQ